MAKENAAVHGETSQLAIARHPLARVFEPIELLVVSARPDLYCLYFVLRSLVIGASNHMVVAAPIAIINAVAIAMLTCGPKPKTCN